MLLKVKYLRSDMPELFSKDGDSGYDLRAAVDAPVVIPAHGIATISAGVCVEVSEYPTDNNRSVELQIRPRSGLTKNGIVTQLGTVDASYRGEIKVNVFNYNDHDIEIAPFERMAQLVICPIYKPEVVSVDALSTTERGDKGFGSSGRN